MNREVVVFIAGSRWNDVTGTDKSLVTALSSHVDVLWVDPPFSLLTRISGRGNGIEGLSQEAPGVWRLQVRTAPGASRYGPLGFIAERQIASRVAREVRRSRRNVLATVVASPRAGFPRSVSGKKVLYVTDDWLEGASLMNLDRNRVEQALVRNLTECDIAFGVSTGVVDMLLALPAEARVEVLANGCDDFGAMRFEDTGSPTAGLVGQLNERLDLDALEAVAGSGATMVVIGPRTDRDPDVGARLDDLLAASNVTWLGPLPHEQLKHHLARMTVGLTPYRDTAFNRASFPLKTLEYLAAGLPVVSTDLPAVRWLDTPFIHVSGTAEGFASQVAKVIRQIPDPTQRTQRSDFARAHTWGARATQFMRLLREPTVSETEELRRS